MSDLVAAVHRLCEETAPGIVWFDSTRAPHAGVSRLFAHPERVLTETVDGFVELPSGQPVDDPVAWMVDTPEELWLAGFLGFEFAWSLDDVRARLRRAQTPALWVGRYERPAASGSNACARDFVAPLSAPALDVPADRYRDNVRRCIEAIAAGELFEVNYTERWEARYRGSPFDLYRAMRERSIGAYFAFLQTDDFAICSVSPEQFLGVSDGRCVARPIKGTRARGETAAEDAEQIADLLGSDKDRAENVMIVDLMRNDLARVCTASTVAATRICDLETFAGVHHLVSTVEGELDPDIDPVVAMVSCFPPGSVTGAPKLRAVELIAELEATPRGPYTGTMFYRAPDGTLESSVLIRTATVVGERVWYGAGGAIVSDSDPEAELREAWAKVSPILRAAEL